MVAFIQLIGKGAEKHTRYSQNIMNVKVKMAGGGGGGGGRGEQWLEIKKIDIKNTLLLLPPSLSNGAGLVRNSKFN